MRIAIRQPTLASSCGCRLRHKDKLQIANCKLTFSSNGGGTTSLQFAICNLQFAICNRPFSTVRRGENRVDARPGMTLLEVILALAIFLFTLAAISQLFSMATDQAADIQFQSRATRLAQSKMSEYVSGVMDFGSNGTSSGTFDPEEPDWNWNADVMPDGSAQNLYHVTITVSRDMPLRGKIQTTLTQWVFDPRYKGYISGQSTLSSSSNSSSSSSSSSSASSSSSGNSMSGGGGGGSMSGGSMGGGATGGSTGGKGGGSMGGSTGGSTGGKTGGSTGGGGGGKGGGG
jgi:general secretion pathway protein I